MAYEPPLPPVEIEPSMGEKIRDAAAAVAALLAVVLIVLGVAVLAGALFSAWSLFRDPAGIEPFAHYFTQLVPGLEGSATSIKGLSTLVAWLFAVLMLLVLGKLASWAIGSASRLVMPFQRHDS